MDGKTNVYELLDQFVSYLSQLNIVVASTKLYIAAVRSFLEYNDIDIVPSKFKRRVKTPKYYPDQEEPHKLASLKLVSYVLKIEGESHKKLREEEEDVY